MDTYTLSTFIDRPSQEVFDFMSNPANFAQWQGGTKSARWASEGPVGVGSIVQSEGRILGRSRVIDAEISQWDPPTTWGIKASTGPMAFDVTTNFESKDGGTLVVQDFNGEISGFLRLFEGLAARQLKKQVQADAKTLKTVLEAR